MKRKLPQGIREKNGSYAARAQVFGQSINLYGKDLDDLIRRFEEAKEKARIFGTVKMRRDFTVDEWWEFWFDTIKKKQIKETSVVTISRNYHLGFGFYLGGKQLVDIYPMDVQCALNAMHEDGKSNKTLRSRVSNLKEMMDYAVANRLIGTNPVYGAALPWENERIKKEDPYTAEEQNEFLAELDKDKNWYRELFYVLFNTGMRVGEIGGLQWGDLDFDSKMIHIQRTLSVQYIDGVKREKLTSPKTRNSDRLIPMQGETEEMLLSQKQKNEELREKLGGRWRSPEELGDLVFFTSMGSPCNRYIVEKEISRITKRINEYRRFYERPEFKKGHPHLIRHAFATRCFEAGIDPKTVQALMGHANISTTLDIYTHVTERKKLEEIAKLGNARKLPEVEAMDLSALPDLTSGAVQHKTVG